ncbi:DUF6075 family protein [Paenibacillus sp. KR2-11]|uniref:DUF6075 family protein n=1 Tax=Paenibacillus sp. KR2-11 TaxID=3385500 RepID=UPI0038FCE291
MPNIHFVNDAHRSNFNKLLIRFQAHKDREYAVACYVLAHPEICRKVNWDRTEYPFDFLKWRGADRVDLSNGFKGIVALAANLFNSSNKFNLMDAMSSWGPELMAVFESAVCIRTGRAAFIQTLDKAQ